MGRTGAYPFTIVFYWVLLLSGASGGREPEEQKGYREDYGLYGSVKPWRICVF